MSILRILVSSAALCAPTLTSLPASAMPAGLIRNAPTIAGEPALIKVRDRYHHSGAAVGAALGAGVVLGALAANSAHAQSEIYVEGPPPPPAYGYDDGGGYDREMESADDALKACERGLLSAAERYGAYDSEVGFIDSIRETPDGGHRVRAEVTLFYPGLERTSDVVCDTADGYLVSARTDY